MMSTRKMARGTRPNPTVTLTDPRVVQAMIKLEARAAVKRGDHAAASRLYTELGIPYVHEVNTIADATSQEIDTTASPMLRGGKS